MAEILNYYSKVLVRYIFGVFSDSGNALSIVILRLLLVITLLFHHKKVCICPFLKCTYIPIINLIGSFIIRFKVLSIMFFMNF